MLGVMSVPLRVYLGSCTSSLVAAAPAQHPLLPGPSRGEVSLRSLSQQLRSPAGCKGCGHISGKGSAGPVWESCGVTQRLHWL